nr:hypothetical protein [Streptomyces alboflavus]
MRTHHPLHDREAQTGARPVGAPLAAPEAVEEVLLVGRRDGGALVVDGDADLPVGLGAGEAHGGAGVRVAQGVVHEVADGALEGERVAEDRQGRAVVGSGEGDAGAGRGEGAALLAYLPVEGGDVDELPALVPRLPAGQREQVVDQRRHALRRAVDAFEGPAAGGRAGRQAGRRRPGWCARSPGRAQFMAGVGHEPLLGRERRVEPVEHVVDRVSEALQLVVGTLVPDAAGEVGGLDLARGGDQPVDRREHPPRDEPPHEHAHQEETEQAPGEQFPQRRQGGAVGGGLERHERGRVRFDPGEVAAGDDTPGAGHLVGEGAPGERRPQMKLQRGHEDGGEAEDDRRVDEREPVAGRVQPPRRGRCHGVLLRR